MLPFKVLAYKLNTVLQSLATIFDDTGHDGQMKDLLTLILSLYAFTLKGNNT